MTKKRDVLKKLRKAAKSAGVEYVETEGANHTVIKLDGLVVPVPRHNEIDNNLVTGIYKEAAEKLGIDWWKK
ncbi:MAG: hypothetical protein WAV90_23920 [Gordonia amarae]